MGDASRRVDVSSLIGRPRIRMLGCAMSPQPTQHLELLNAISEVMALLAGSPNVESFLQRTVTMVAEHLETDVCSIYLYREDLRMLVLRATVGLNPASVNTLALQEGEGLVGTALKERRPLCETCASRNPAFKHFPESGEDHFESFLAVPILRGIEKIGVLVVQRREQSPFDHHDMITLRVLTSQLATAIENARTLLSARSEEASGAAPILPGVVHATVVSPGLALADSLVVRRRRAAAMLRREAAARGTGDVAGLERAVADTMHQIEDMQRHLPEKLPEAADLVFAAHLMMLKDEGFVGRMRTETEHGTPASNAIAATALTYVDLFEASRHDYMREKARDVEDLAARLLRNLHREQDDDGAHRGRIVITYELLPSDVIKLALDDVKAVILTSGGTTTHVSIMARSLQLPMFIVDNPELLDIDNDVPILVDGHTGNIFVQPSDEVRHRFEAQQAAQRVSREARSRMRDRTLTRDGERVHLLANINLLSELDLAIELKAEGIGLYRTEFPFLIRQSLPSEEDQIRVYRRLFARMEDREVTVRMLDTGGEKLLGYFDDAGEANPELGLRSMRFLRRHPDIFAAQARAILCAAGGRSLRILFPMINSVDEFRWGRDVIMNAQRDVLAEGADPVALEVGMMVETPAALITLDELAKEADFLSIGTNDFIQYLLAVDRGNRNVAEFYRADHPAVLRGIMRIAEAAQDAGKDVSVCGEMAHDLRYLPFLLGVGIRKLSLDPTYLPSVQEAICNMRITDAKRSAADLLAARTLDDVTKRIRAGTRP
jgi:phosphotransferase system enzyme I (PtsP)